jgi:hypothetical protein
MRTRRISLLQNPHAVGENVIVLFPTIQVDVVEFPGVDLAESFHEAAGVVSGAFSGLCFFDLLKLAEQKPT